MDEQILTQLKNQLHMDAHHAVDEALGAPATINRVVGEAMRHIGGILELQSSSYLPIRPEEILVKPKRIFNNDCALVLVNRVLPANDSFTVLAHITSEDGNKNFELFAFKINNCQLTQSKIINLNEIFGTEIIRQLNALKPTDGVSILQAAVLQDFFKNYPEVEDNLPPTEGEEVAAFEPKQVLPQVVDPQAQTTKRPSVLPPVMAEELF